MNDKGYLFPVDGIRALAIILVVLQHSLSLFNYENLKGSVVYTLVGNLAYNSTLYLVLISGFIFQHLSYKFHQVKFIESKIKNVICPYVFITFVSILCLSQLQFVNFIPATYDGSSVFSFLAERLLHGTATYQLWFIPMIAVIFLCSPIFILLSKINLAVYGFVAFLWMLLYIRPENSYDLVGDLVYFIPAYLLGMALCQNKDAIIAMSVRDVIILLLTVFFVSVYGTFAQIFGYYFFMHGFWTNTLSKILLFVCAINLLAKIEYSMPAMLKKVTQWVAKISFTLYFLHTLILIKLLDVINGNPTFDQLLNTNKGWLASGIAIILCFLTIGVCGLIRHLVGRLVGNKSKYLIGS